MITTIALSFHYAGVISNKVIEEKDKEEGWKEGQQDNTDSDKNQNQEQQQHLSLSLSTQAYKLFSQYKTPLEVSIALNLRESEATNSTKSIGS